MHVQKPAGDLDVVLLLIMTAGTIRYVPQGKIRKLEDIFLYSMPIKEHQIVEFFLGTALKDEVMKIMPVQKQTRAGQRTRFKACTMPSRSHAV